MLCDSMQGLAGGTHFFHATRHRSLHEQRHGRRGRKPCLPCNAILVLNPTGSGDSSHLPQEASAPKPFELPEGTALIGRENADYNLPFATVSLLHAKIEVLKNGELYITDLGSTNGTTLSGRPLKARVRTRVNVGDEVQFGDPYLARFLVEETATSSRTRSRGGGTQSSPFDLFQSAVAAAATAVASTAPKAPPPAAAKPAEASSSGRQRTQQPPKQPARGEEQPVPAAAPPPPASAGAAASAAPPPRGQFVVPELSFDDERMAAEAAVRAVEESLGMSVGEWRNKLDEIARMAVRTGPISQSRDATVVTSPSTGAGVGESGAGRGQKAQAQAPDRDEPRRRSAASAEDPEVLPPAKAGSGALGIRRADSSDVASAPNGGGFGGALLGALGNFITSSNVQINNQVTNVYNVSLGSVKGAEIAEAKAVLLRCLLGTDRGATLSAAARGRIEAATRALEALNPTPKPLRSPILNGRWELQFSTSRTGLGAGSGIPGLRPTGAPCQTIDMFGLLLLNEEVYEPLPFLRWTNASASELIARTDSRVAVRVKGFKVGGIDVKAPPERTAARWEEAIVSGGLAEPFLEFTYLDYDLRITRNHAGNLFVFTRPPIEA